MGGVKANSQKSGPGFTACAIRFIADERGIAATEQLSTWELGLAAYLREQGASYVQIARVLDRTPPGVRYWLIPEAEREEIRSYSNSRYRALRQQEAA